VLSFTLLLFFFVSIFPCYFYCCLFVLLPLFLFGVILLVAVMLSCGAGPVDLLFIGCPLPQSLWTECDFVFYWSVVSRSFLRFYCLSNCIFFYRCFAANCSRLLPFWLHLFLVRLSLFPFSVFCVSRLFFFCPCFFIFFPFFLFPFFFLCVGVLGFHRAYRVIWIGLTLPPPLGLASQLPFIDAAFPFDSQKFFVQCASFWLFSLLVWCRFLPITLFYWCIFFFWGPMPYVL